MVGVGAMVEGGVGGVIGVHLLTLPPLPLEDVVGVEAVVEGGEGVRDVIGVHLLMLPPLLPWDVIGAGDRVGDRMHIDL